MDALIPPPTWLDRAREMSVSFAPGDVDKLGLYLALLLDTNRRMNLTGIREPAEAWDKHILDALSLLPMLADLPDGGRVLDLGSGGGVPGVPLAIIQPRLRFTLMDATAKKTAFLTDACAQIGLSNVEVLTGRAEQFGRDVRHRATYDAVCARAVGRLATLAELAVPFAAVGGLCLLVKGAKADEELEEAKKALHMLHTTHAGTVETPTGRVVVLEKRRPTPKLYPRRDGEPKRMPLGVNTNEPRP